jgi:glyoxylase-like metal-dependent hydrolase (beta-lactamase superfamily II)
VHRVFLGLVNVYLVGPQASADRSWVLVDAGLSLGASAIIRAAEKRFGAGHPPAAIVLTHGHFDHVGALPALVRYWDVPVYAHELELPYLTGKSSYPPPDPGAGGGMMSFCSQLLPRGPIDLSDKIKPLPPSGEVPRLPAWRWIHTPGHTEGHVALFRDDDRTLLAGDAFVTTRQESLAGVLTQRPVVHRPPAYYTTNWEAARRSVQQLADLAPQLAATGHGVPMSGDQLRTGLEQLLTDWDRAVPAHGRYSRRPAVADRHGVVSLPPPTPWSLAPAAAAMTLAAGLVGVVALRRPKDRGTPHGG